MMRITATKGLNKLSAYLALTCLLVFCSCQKTFKEDYQQLRLDATEYMLTGDGGSFELMVYYSSSWKATLRSEETDWVILSRTSASGQSYMRVTWDSAVDHSRSAFIDIDAGKGGRQTITLIQNAI